MVNSEIYHTDTRQHANFHQHSMNFNKYQKAIYYRSVKLIKMLPTYIKIESDNQKKFKLRFQKISF
jgi:hypothetical protein